MPVSVKIDPFSRQPIRPGLALLTPQARVLAALQPEYPDDPLIDWPVVTRAQLGVRAGYTTVSGTVTRALNGVRAGSSSGEPHPGLLARKLVEEVVLDIDGRAEVNYRATTEGVRAYRAYIEARGGKLPPNRSAETSMKINRTTLRRLGTYSRRQLKAIHLYLTGRSAFGLKADILDLVEEAVREHLGMDE